MKVNQFISSIFVACYIFLALGLPSQSYGQADSIGNYHIGNQFVVNGSSETNPVISCFQEMDSIPTAVVTKQQKEKAIWDIQFAYPLSQIIGTAGLAGSETDGTHLFAAHWGYQNTRKIFRLTMSGVLVDSINPSWISTSTGGIRDMAWDGYYLYGSDVTNTIYCFTVTGQLINTITSPVVVRSIAYDNINDAFWVNNWTTNINLVSRTGFILDTLVDPPSMYGSAYDNVTPGGPYLWIFTGTSIGNGCQIQQYVIATKTLTTIYHSVSSDFGISDLAGGLWSHPNIIPGKFTIGGIAQGSLTLFAYEVSTILPANDIGISSITEPSSGALTNAETVKVVVTNHGTATQSSFSVSYLLPNGIPVKDTVTVPIVSGGSYEHTFSQTADLGTPGAYYILTAWTSLNGDEISSNDTLSKTITNTAFVQSGIKLRIKAFLQGAYLGNGMMGTNLYQGGHIPLYQPYSALLYAYTGNETLPVALPGMVDWVLIDLRSTPDTAIVRKAALIYSDGIIRDVNGSDSLLFPVPTGSYYIAINHRNSLSAMTAQKLSLPSAGTIDFTDTTFAMYGNCQIHLPGNVMGLISGDINHDRVLKYSGPANDRSPILQRILMEVGGTAINATTTGYFVEDLRMDGVVKYSGSQNDPSLIIQNIVSLTGTNAINSVFHGSVPHAVYAPYSCYPQPDQANAGPDSLNIPSTSITLQANEPVNGTGLWTILSGTGGSLLDSTVYNTLFTGQVGSAYTLVWTISNACGSSSDTVVIAFVVTSSYPTGYVHCNPANPTAIVDVTNPVTGRTWMDRNLGASQAATSATDANAYGDLYQWGRFADGHQCRTSGTTTALSSTNQPGHGSFIRAPNYPSDWRSPQNNNLWQGVNGVNNPCPAGYRLPTDAELNAEMLSWSSNNSAGAYGSPLKLPLAGLRHGGDGSLYFVGSYGFYWSGAVSGTTSRLLYFSSSLAYLNTLSRADGYSVRCTKDY